MKRCVVSALCEEEADLAALKEICEGLGFVAWVHPQGLELHELPVRVLLLRGSSKKVEGWLAEWGPRSGLPVFVLGSDASMPKVQRLPWPLSADLLQVCLEMTERHLQDLRQLNEELSSLVGDIQNLVSKMQNEVEALPEPEETLLPDVQWMTRIVCGTVFGGECFDHFRTKAGKQAGFFHLGANKSRLLIRMNQILSGLHSPVLQISSSKHITLDAPEWSKWMLKQFIEKIQAGTDEHFSLLCGLVDASTGMIRVDWSGSYQVWVQSPDGVVTQVKHAAHCVQNLDETYRMLILSPGFPTTERKDVRSWIKACFQRDPRSLMGELVFQARRRVEPLGQYPDFSMLMLHHAKWDSM
jgi:hypothetical protein